LAKEKAAQKVAGKSAKPSRPKAAPAAGLASGPQTGILPAHAIDALIAAGEVQLARPADREQVQPASLDLRLGATAYRVRASFLPGPGERVEARMRDLVMHQIDLTGGAVLERDCVYIVPLLESLALAADTSAITNPKSSTGRLDVFTRVICDGSRAFDQIGAGYAGPLYAEICPQTFPVLVRTGSRLSQIRFRRPLAARQPRPVLADHPELLAMMDGDATLPHLAGIPLSVELGGEPGQLIGYRAKRHTGVIDVDAPGSCDIAEYWESLHADRTRRLILDPDEFYILASKEAVHVPPAYAAEMVPFNPLVGEFRVHYAGFFDPGFGHQASGGGGSRAVLEVRSHKVPFIIEDGQIIGHLIYEHLSERPQRLYGSDIGSHYQAQGLKLSKHFRS
jgi:dCTP deaminase